MRRRKYLTLAAASGGSLLAGCTGSGDSDSDQANTQTDALDETDATTASPTESQTESAPAAFDVDVSAPTSVSLGEPIRFEITVENTGGSEGTWSGDLYIKTTYGPEPQDWNHYTPELTLAAGSSRTWETDTATYEQPVVVYYQFGDAPAQTVDIPESKAPIIETTNLVSSWETYGDALDNQITETEAGTAVNIASRYWYWAENQTNNTFKQVEIYDSDDERVAIETDSSEQVTEQNGWGPWESYIGFDSTGWGAGTYTAEMLIRDNQTQEVSNAGTVEFQLTES